MQRNINITIEEIMKEKGIDESYIDIFLWIDHKFDVRLFPRGDLEAGTQIDPWAEVRDFCSNEREIIEMIDFYYEIIEN